MSFIYWKLTLHDSWMTIEWMWNDLTGTLIKLLKFMQLFSNNSPTLELTAQEHYREALKQFKQWPSALWQYSRIKSFF